MIIREVTPDDAAGLRELYLEHLKNPPEPIPESGLEGWHDILREIIADPAYHLLVAEEDGRVISSVTLVIIRNLTNNLRSYGVIENVVTHSGYRGRGFAAALMNHAKALARERGCYKIMLMTGSKRDSTLRFYEKCGFDRHEKTAFIHRMP